MSRIVHGITYSHRVVHKIKYMTGYALEGVRGRGDYTYVVWDKGVEPEIVPWEYIEKFVGWDVTLPRSPVVKVLNEVSVTLDIPTEIEYGGRVYILKERMNE